jgi:Tfp pilus assembly pilus retraction ATPase PilT
MFEELIGQARALGASDVHLEADTPIVARIRGELQTVGANLSANRLMQASQTVLGAEGWALFRARGSADVSVAIAGTRCRASFFQTVLQPASGSATACGGDDWVGDHLRSDRFGQIHDARRIDRGDQCL